MCMVDKLIFFGFQGNQSLENCTKNISVSLITQSYAEGTIRVKNCILMKIFDSFNFL